MTGGPRKKKKLLNWPSGRLKNEKRAWRKREIKYVLHVTSTANWGRPVGGPKIKAGPLCQTFDSSRPTTAYRWPNYNISPK